MTGAIRTRPDPPATESFGGISAPPSLDPPGPPNFVEIRSSPEFIRLRRRLLRFVFPMSLLFFAWYMTYVLLAAYAPGLMSQRVFGSINVGLVLGVLQFISTVAITTGYARFATKRIDPQVDLIREKAGVASQ